MPPPQPKTPQSNTLFQYFVRTPKRASQVPDSSNLEDLEPSSTTSDDIGRSNNDSPKVVQSKPSVTSSTPTNGSSKSKKRRTTDSPSAAESSAKKRPREDSPGAEFKEGSIVWAKLEGFPWWAAMVRGERNPGEPFSRKDMTEFHVQFFDNPPSRAWIRKPDLKAYGGSQDGSVPPARFDPRWIDSCKSADTALLISPKKRVEKYWVNFDIEGNGRSSLSDNSDEEDRNETPRRVRKSDAKLKTQAKKRLVIQSSDDEDANNNEDCNSSKLEDGNTPTRKANGLTKRLNGNVSDDEYEPSPTKVAEGSDASEISEEEEGESDNDISTPDEEEEEDDSKRNRQRKRKTTTESRIQPKITPSRSSIKSSVKARLSHFNNSDATSPNTTTPVSHISTDRTEQWPHLKLSFLQPDRIQDNHRRRPSDPDYNPRTLFIPKDYLDKLTPAIRQWWMLKSQNYDTILFFKVGKFYEFYHMDAVITVQELSIEFMKGDFAHSGFPEVSYSKYASILVEKGYKVARIEQTETPDMMTERCKKIKPTKFDKVVNREICQISTRGVRYASFQDFSSSPFSPESVFLYGIVEKVSSNRPPEFGVSFVDTTIGNFFIGQFEDDRHCSRLRTLFAHHIPAQILYERGKLSSSTQQLLNNLTGVRKDSLAPESEFWGAQKVLKYLSEQSYFQSSSGNLVWPENLKTLLSPGDSLGLTPEDGFELGLKGLGGVVWYLKHCLLDNDLLSLKKFSTYKPIDSLNLSHIPALPQQNLGPKYMVLDGITLRNLDVTEGTRNLLTVVDRCSTHFGKRLLRHWVCMPLAIPDEISERLDAVEELMSNEELTQIIIPMLKTLPDLERLLNKVHYLGSAHRSKNHPEGRAFFFDEIKYSKNKIFDLISILKGFKTCKKIVDLMQNNDQEIKSKLLVKLLSDFPCLDKLLEKFDNAFDANSAVKEGKIIPKDGVDEEFDSAKKKVMDVNQSANEYLKKVSKELRVNAVYFGSDKKRFQLEVPENTKVPREFEMSSSKKGFKRYYNSKTKEFLATIMQAESVREEVLRDITRRIFEKFDKHREVWKQGVDCIGKLDALLSLSAFSSSSEDMCRPRVIYSDSPFVKIIEGRHPMTSIDSYIANSCCLGSTSANSQTGTFILLTGPNMGGKSTLMRQVGLLSILAQMGCYVPAKECEISTVDRIFTRLGANDNIGEGESTFFVEMSETSAILKHCTKNSLILMDELGRGTATYDGTAIAYAVSTALAAKESRTIFSTHYHTLVETIEHLPSVELGHMACMVENENEDDPTQETITFLYKMVPGACPKSYGFNAARLAGIPDDVVRVAHRKAKEFEAAVNKVDLFRNIHSKIAANKLTLNSAKLLGLGRVL